MTELGLGMTAKITAAARAQENCRVDRLFFDPFADALAGEEGVRWKDELYTAAENPTIGPRTRFFDDLVLAAMASGLRQVVLVAAGMDTRVFRLPLPVDTVVYELDQPHLLAEKQTILDAEHAASSCSRVAVPADLADDGWPQELLRASFDPSRPHVSIAEGLSMYLTDVQLGSLLERLAGLAAPGSMLGADMTTRTYLDDPGHVEAFAALAERGIHWRFGTDDPVGFLTKHGWSAEASRFDLVGRSYGRWPPPGIPDDEATRAAVENPSYYFVTAHRG